MNPATANTMPPISAPQRSISLGGKVYVARQTTMGDLSDFEGYLRGLNVNNFLGVLSKHDLSAEVISETLARLYNDPWTPDAKMAHSQSIAGLQFFLYRALRKDNPMLSFEIIGEMITDTQMPEVLSAIEALRPPVSAEAEQEVPLEVTKDKEPDKIKE